MRQLNDLKNKTAFLADVNVNLFENLPRSLKAELKALHLVWLIPINPPTNIEARIVKYTRHLFELFRL